jgi:hypothetical protein
MKTIFGISTLLLIVGAMVTGCGGGSGDSSTAAASCNSSVYSSLQSVNGQNVCCANGITASTYSAYGSASSGCVLQSSLASGGGTTQSCLASGGELANFGNGTYGCCPAGYPLSPYLPLSTVQQNCPVVSPTTGYGVGTPGYAGGAGYVGYIGIP